MRAAACTNFSQLRGCASEPPSIFRISSIDPSLSFEPQHNDWGAKKLLRCNNAIPPGIAK
jgi:hypothetical protein